MNDNSFLGMFSVPVTIFIIIMNQNTQMTEKYKTTIKGKGKH